MGVRTGGDPLFTYLSAGLRGDEAVEDERGSMAAADASLWQVRSLGKMVFGMSMEADRELR